MKSWVMKSGCGSYRPTGDKAVTERGAYVTGGQTCGEIWTPMGKFSARLGDKNQEHCTVYNMMRVADFLFRVTGESKYMDYYELNLYNGIMAQAYWKGNFTHGQASEHPDSALLTYFLPLRSGAHRAGPRVPATSSAATARSCRQTRI